MEFSSKKSTVQRDLDQSGFIKIAITGKMGSGKSTLAKILQTYTHGYITSFSSQIRKVLSLTNLPSSRDTLQATGDFFRTFNNIIWVNMLLKELENQKKNCIIDGIRYPFEAEELVKTGFIIIKIESSEHLRRDRISKRDNIQISDEAWHSWSSHPTEQFLDQIKYDYSLTNNGSMKSLEKELLTILKELSNKK